MSLRRVVVVGCGSIGQRHARLLAQHSHLQVELCDFDRESINAATAALGEMKCHYDFDEMLSTRPEMIVIATPHDSHADITIAALRAGIHVLCEKPMSDNLIDAQRMVNAAAKSRAILDFGFHLHFHPGLRRLKQLIVSGELGTVLHLHCRVGTYITLLNSCSRYQAGVEGALLFDYAHQPDLSYWLLGAEPRGVYMAAILGGNLPMQSNPNLLSLTLDYATPLLATIHLNYVQMPQQHEYEIVGDRSWAILDADKNRLRIGRRQQQDENVETFVTDRDEIYQAEHQAFFDAVEGRRQAENPPANALVSMRIIDAALRSWKESRRVLLDPERHHHFLSHTFGKHVNPGSSELRMRGVEK